jgi:regulation of enolase protein 1 (concanavalin A-like superfamily)
MTQAARGPELPGFHPRARWLAAPAAWTQEADGAVAIAASARTDRFHDPAGVGRQADSPLWLTEVEPPATLVARVQVAFADTFDAGVLMAYQSADAWAKLCFERAPDGRHMVVSVVTRGRSDDANAFVVDGDAVWLRVSALGAAYAFHASLDGRAWDLVRYFGLGTRGRPRVGLSVQAPMGAGCVATFGGVRLTPGVVRDIRGRE